MTELLLLSNSTAPGGTFLAHALDLIAEMVPPRSRLLFVPYASGDPAPYTAVMQDGPAAARGRRPSGALRCRRGRGFGRGRRRVRRRRQHVPAAARASRVRPAGGDS